MIFYFTGTGNSLYVAKKLKSKNEKIISIAKEMQKNQDVYKYEIEENENIVFVCPVYAWAPPQMVTDFIKKINIKKANYISAVITCGEQIGNAMDILKDSLGEVGLNLNSGFSVVAPNNYIIIGNIDDKEVENNKLIMIEDEIEYISKILRNKENNMYKIEKGKTPKFTTNIINPFFNKYARSSKKFYTTDKCCGCKVCEKVCNSGCIKVNDKPVWDGHCTQCLACINYCPTKAIQYGKGTVKKGRYTNPNIDVSEMF